HARRDLHQAQLHLRLRHDAPAQDEPVLPAHQPRDQHQGRRPLGGARRQQPLQPELSQQVLRLRMRLRPLPAKGDHVPVSRTRHHRDGRLRRGLV
ncbi:hypothetical protein BN1708_020331, partial [Verticillium longisporum]